MNPETRAAFIEHARAEMPREACGLVVIVNGGERYLPCRNTASNLKHFVMDPEDYARAEDAGEITAVVHSHPDASSKASEADMVSCELSGLPWFIVSMPDGVWNRIEPRGYQAPLVGRQFSYGVLDCYTLVRDWFRRERAIELIDFDRGDFGWWDQGGNLYMEGFPKAGFVPVEKPEQPGDLILMTIRSPVVNHAAIYLGGDVMLHHLINRLSSREIYGGWYRKITRLTIRYKGIA